MTTDKQTIDAPAAQAAPAVTTAIAEYSPTAVAMAELRQRFENVVFDVTTPAGDREARAARKQLVQLRTALEAKRVELKAPALERSRLIDAEAKRITGEIRKLEQPIDEAIQAEEKRKEAERQAKLQAEQQRLAGLQRRCAALASFPVRAMGEPATAVEDLIRELVAVDIDASFQELQPTAEAAKAASLAKLRELHQAAVDAEAEAARVAAERAQIEREQAELRRQQAELEQQRAAQEAAAAAERQRIEAEDRARREAAEAAERERREAAEAEERARRFAAEVAERRRAEVDARIAAIRMYPARSAGLPAARILELRRQLDEYLDDNNNLVAPERYDDRADEAREAVVAAWRDLGTQLDARMEADAEAARLAAEREALEREKATAEAERQAREEAERQAAEAREREQREAREAVEREAAEVQARLHGAAARMLSALYAVQADPAHDALDEATQHAVSDAVEAATLPNA